MKINDITRRTIIIGAIVAVLAISCIIKLFNLQIVNGEEYRIQADNRTIRTYATKAPRGEIFDRNGVPVVENRCGYSIQIFKTDISSEELNKNINDIVKLLHENGDEYTSTFPIEYNEEEEIPEYNFEKSDSAVSSADGNKNKESDEEKKDREKKIQEDTAKNIAEWESQNKVDTFNTLREIVKYYAEKYEISDDFNETEKLDIMAVRYEMEQRKFSGSNPFVLATDVSNIVIQKIKETYYPTGFADIIADTIRNYAKGNMAAHILGRTGIIYAEEYEKLKDSGYGMNDIIGKDGLEAVLEPYLKGTDGYKKVRMTSDGRYGDVVDVKPAKAGNYAELTIDAELQEAAEKYAADPDSMSFNCYFLGGVDKFVMDGHTITGLDAQGQEVFSHTYKLLDEKNENGFIFYQSEDENSGEFTYFAFSPDTMETTYHLEFRYAEDLNDLQSWFEGNYAYWNAAAIAEDYDQATMENVIELFATENLSEAE